MSAWKIAAIGACDMRCDHSSCLAFQLADGRCVLCEKDLDEAFFVHREDGTGASHPNCRLKEIGRQPLMPRMVSTDGEFRIAVPRSEDEAEVLRWYADAACRFLIAVETALGAYGQPRVAGGRR